MMKKLLDVSFRASRFLICPRQTIVLLVLTLTSCISIILVIRSMIAGYELFRSVPYLDQWEFIKQIPMLFSGKFAISDLFTQHNEHRIATAKLIFIVDLLAFDLTSYFCLVCTYILCIAIALIFARLAHENFITIWAVLSSLMLSPAQYENLASGFQVSFPLLQICATGSIICLIRHVARRNESVLFLLVAVLLDSLAVCSLASGVLLFVPLSWMAIIYRHHLRRLMPYIVCHCVATWAFFRGYNPTSGIQKSHKIFKICEFAVLYLGSCLRDYGGLSAFAGCMMIILLASAMGKVMLRAKEHRSDPDRVQVAAVALALFTVAGALVTGVGRVSLGLEAAAAPRYAFFSLIMVLCLFVYVWRELGPRRGTARSMLLAATTAISMLTNLSPESMAEWQERANTYDLAGFALVNGVWSDQRLELIYPTPELIREPLRFLAQHRLAVFSPRFAPGYQPPLNAVQGEQQSAPFHCDVRVNTVTRTGPNWIELTGATDAAGQGGWILAFDDEHRLLGYAPWTRSAISQSGGVDFDMALNAAELSNVGGQALTFVLVPQRPSRRNCSAQVRVELPPQ